MQSSENPNPRPLQHTPLHPEDGFRTPAEASDEDVRLARRYQAYGGTRFVEDDLAGDPEAGALASNGQGPPSITDRLRSTADGAQAAAELERWLARRELARQRRAGREHCRRRSLGLARGTGWVLENTLFRPQQGSEGAAVQDVRSANGMNDATQP